MAFHIPPALRYRRFALLWGGQLISIAGSQMQLAALLWHLRTLSDQPILVSGIGLVRFLPILLFSPISGVVADTFNRRKILFITQSVMAITALMLGLLTWWGTIQIWHIYLLTGIQAIAISFDLPARQALMPNLLPRSLLPNAFSLQSIAQNTGSIAGPALGGMVIGYLGQQYTYLFNAVSFGAVLLALVLMGPVLQESLSGQLTFRSSWISIREGVHFITHQPIILSSMLLDFVATFFSSATTLLPFVARDILHVDEIAYGWLVSSESVGAVLVGLIMSQRTNIRRQGALLMMAVAAFGAATILLGLSTSVFMAMLALALVGATDSISTILRNTIRQLQTPDFIRGRMVSLNAIFFQGGPQLGEIESGIVAQLLGAPMAIVTGGIGCIVSVLIVAFASPQLRKYRGDEPTLVPAD
jgi:MFS family permease